MRSEKYNIRPEGFHLLASGLGRLASNAATMTAKTPLAVIVTAGGSRDSVTATATRSNSADPRCSVMRIAWRSCTTAPPVCAKRLRVLSS
eukprot:8968809-Pyramimonas_sp.AAC.1